MLNDLVHLLEDLDIHLFTLALSAITDVIRISNAQQMVLEIIKTNFVPKIISSIEVHPHLLNLDTLNAFWTTLAVNGGLELIKFSLDALDKTSIEQTYTKTVVFNINTFRRMLSLLNAFPMYV